MTSTPVLQSPDFNKPFTIQTDACQYAISGVIALNNNGQDYVIAYTSRTLTKSDVNYDIIQKECLAVIHSVHKFRSYVEGTKFIIITDHWNLIWLNNLEQPSGRLALWSLFLRQFDYDLVYCPGKNNIVADAFRGAPPPINQEMR